jgi:hypothetical protein
VRVLADAGVRVDPSLVHQPEVLAAVVVGLLGFPLWAALGTGVGALLGRSLGQPGQRGDSP